MGEIRISIGLSLHVLIRDEGNQAASFYRTAVQGRSTGFCSGQTRGSAVRFMTRFHHCNITHHHTALTWTGRQKEPSNLSSLAGLFLEVAQVGLRIYDVLVFLV